MSFRRARDSHPIHIPTPSASLSVPASPPAGALRRNLNSGFRLLASGVVAMRLAALFRDLSRGLPFSTCRGKAPQIKFEIWSSRDRCPVSTACPCFPLPLLPKPRLSNFGFRRPASNVSLRRASPLLLCPSRPAGTTSTSKSGFRRPASDIRQIGVFPSYLGFRHPASPPTHLLVPARPSAFKLRISMSGDRHSSMWRVPIKCMRPSNSGHVLPGSTLLLSKVCSYVSTFETS